MIRTMLATTALAAALLFGARLTLAEEAKPKAPAAAQPAAPDNGKHGCMPDGGCCGKAECAQAASQAAPEAGKPAGCPCQQKKAAQAAEKQS